MTDATPPGEDEAAEQDMEMELEDLGGEDDDDEEYFDDSDEDDNMVDPDEDGWYASSRSRSVFIFPSASSPQAAGVNLIKGGEFGRVIPKIKARRNNKNLAAVLSNRLTKPNPILYKEDYSSVCSYHCKMPSKTQDTVSRTLSLTRME